MACLRVARPDHLTREIGKDGHPLGWGEIPVTVPHPAKGFIIQGLDLNPGRHCRFIHDDLRGGASLLVVGEADGFTGWEVLDIQLGVQHGDRVGGTVPGRDPSELQPRCDGVG